MTADGTWPDHKPVAAEPLPRSSKTTGGETSGRTGAVEGGRSKGGDDRHAALFPPHRANRHLREHNDRLKHLEPGYYGRPGWRGSQRSGHRLAPTCARYPAGCDRPSARRAVPLPNSFVVTCAAAGRGAPAWRLWNCGADRPVEITPSLAASSAINLQTKQNHPMTALGTAGCTNRRRSSIVLASLYMAADAEVSEAVRAPA